MRGVLWLPALKVQVFPSDEINVYMKNELTIEQGERDIWPRHQSCYMDFSKFLHDFVKIKNGFLKVEYEEWADSWARREGHMAETSKALPIPRIVSLQSDNPGNNGLFLWQWPRQCPKMSNNVWRLWHKTGRWGGGAGLIHENGETFGKRASATIQSFIHTRTNHP